MSTLPTPAGPNKGQLILDFHGHQIRWGGPKDCPWFVAQDVCDVLDIAEARSAIRSLPEDEKGVQTLHTPGGTQKLLILYEPGLYRLIFRSTKPEAEEFRRWVFHEVLPAIRKTGEYRSKERGRYQRLGKDQQWIDSREKGIEVRNSFTKILQDHGVSRPVDYAQCTDAVNLQILGATSKQMKRKLQIPVRAKLRDYLDNGKLLAIGLAEYHAGEKIERIEAQGYAECRQVSLSAASHVASAVKQIQEG
jgi:prophage antirepressor-like protein